MAGEPERSDVKAICTPVGDQVGVVSMAGWFVSRRMPPPSRFITYSSGLPSRFDVKAILVPSGDQAGSQFCVLPLVGSSRRPS